ncbi:MAG: hypothetical protein K6F88_03430 [Ruminococcus sp.]|nr:hypothetical protein [Ruminococcus sp.]
METIKSFKGFNKDLKCRDFQYEIGKEYETERAECCESGFHACENPIDVFSYYPPADSRYCEVEQSGEFDRMNGDSKVASTKIKIGGEIGLNGLIKAFVKFTLERVKFEEAATNTGFKSAATNTGNYSAATVGKGGSVATVTGYQSKARASIGSAICICERGEWNGQEYPLIGIKAAIIDGKKLKADTFYTLKNGEFVEVKE